MNHPSKSPAKPNSSANTAWYIVKVAKNGNVGYYEGHDPDFGTVYWVFDKAQAKPFTTAVSAERYASNVLTQNQWTRVDKI